MASACSILIPALRAARLRSRFATTTLPAPTRYPHPITSCSKRWCLPRTAATPCHQWALRPPGPALLKGTWRCRHLLLPRLLPLQEDIEQVILEIDIARQVLVVHAKKKGIGQREEYVLGARHRGIQRLARQQRRFGDLAVAGFEHQAGIVDPGFRRLDGTWKQPHDTVLCR